MLDSIVLCDKEKLVNNDDTNTELSYRRSRVQQKIKTEIIVTEDTYSFTQFLV